MLARLALALAFVALAAPAVEAQARRPRVTLGGGPTAAGPQQPVVTWRARAEPVARRPGHYRLVLRGEIAEGWRVYAMDAQSGRPLQVALDELPRGFRLERAPQQRGRPETGRDPALGTTYTYYDGAVEVAARVRGPGRVAGRTRPVVRGRVSYAACNDQVCLPPRTEAFEAALAVGR